MATRKDVNGVTWNLDANGEWDKGPPVPIGQGIQARGVLIPKEVKPADPYEAPKAVADLVGKGLSNQRTTQDIGLDRSKVGIGLASQFAADPRVKAYREVLPSVASAMTARPDARGDLTVIYSWAKAMDPMGSVREGDTDMAKSSASFKQRFDQYVNQVNVGNGLPKEVRTGLINEMRNRGSKLDQAYSEARRQYVGLTKEAGLNPDIVIGPHDGAKYQQDEANYKGAPIRNLDGSQGAVPDPERWNKVSDKEIHDFVVKYQGLPEPVMQELAKEKLGRSIDNWPALMTQLRQDGRLTKLVNRSEGLNPELMGFLKGGKGVWDRAAQGLQGGVNALTGSNFQSADRASEVSDNYFAQQPTDPTFETGGQIAAGALMAAPFGGPVTQGAIGGMLMGNADTPLGLAGEAATGAVAGKIGDKLLKGGARLIGAEIDPAARRLVQEGARLTPGRIFPSLRIAEDLGDTLPFVGPKIRAAQEKTMESINRIPANRSLAPIGETLPENIPAGHGAVAYTQGKLSDFYNQALAGKQIGLDPTFATRLNTIGQRSKLRPQEFDDLTDIVQRELGGAFQTGPQLGQMSGRTFKNTDERLGDIVTGFNRMDDPFKRQEGKILGDVLDEFKGLARRQSPQMADDLRAADEGWANFVRYRAAAKSSPADGLANPGQFRTAASQSDKTVGKGATARGEALMQDFASDASKIIPSDFGNSGTSPREAFSQFRPWGMVKGAALSPLYSDPLVEIMNKMAGRTAGPLSKGAAKALRALPAGPLGGLAPWLIESGQ